jgi:hypothetical protein
MEKKKVQVKLLGAKMKKDENDASPFPFKGHQTWNLPKATKH